MRSIPQTRRSLRSVAAGALCAAVLALAVAAFAPAPARAQQQIVKLATLVPEGTVWDKSMRDMGAQWSASTQGRVVLRVYPGGVAGDEPDVVRKMRIGQLQAAAITTGGLADIDPSFNVFNIPMFFTSYPELYATLDQLTPVLRQRLEAKGFVLLAWATAAGSTSSPSSRSSRWRSCARRRCSFGRATTRWWRSGGGSASSRLRSRPPTS